jgi:heme-degrading monooxygenase HmoA
MRCASDADASSGAPYSRAVQRFVLLLPFFVLHSSNSKEIVVILEMAYIDVQEGKGLDLEAGARKALPLFARSKGCHGAELHRVVEHANRYVLIVRWESVDDHMVHFRQSDDFQEWRRLVGPYFAAPPQVHHTEVVVQ